MNKRPFLRHQFAVPLQQGVWADDRIEIPKALPTHRLGLLGKASSLRVGEEETAPTKLLSQHPVVRLQVFEHLGLLPLQPAGEHQEEELQQLRGSHRTHMAAALPSRVNRRALGSIGRVVLVFEHDRVNSS